MFSGGGVLLGMIPPNEPLGTVFLYDMLYNKVHSTQYSEVISAVYVCWVLIHTSGCHKPASTNHALIND